MSLRTRTLYQTLPLDSAQRKIRILHLLPGIAGKVRGELHIVNLDDKRESYTSVSYVWGNTAITKPIWIDGEELQVTTNLFALLLHIRHPQNVTVLWIDAICINQNDQRERSHQVGLMDDVYSLCSSVYIWLGAPCESILVKKDPFCLFKHFAEGKHYHDLPGYFRNSEGEWTFDEANPDFQQLWEAFLLVADNVWWTRAWTVQEVILPTGSTIHLGEWQTTYETISLARNRRDSQLGGCCAQSRAVQSFAIRHKFDHFLGEVARIDLVHYPRLKQGQSAVADIMKSKSAHQLPALYQVVLSFAARQCKDPRDKVFSILGLAKGSVFSDFKPDYAVAVARCYTDFFARVIQWSGGDYRVLLGSAFGPSLSGMPSWSRNFSHPYSSELIGQEMRQLQVYSLYDCSNGRIGRLKVLNQKELYVQAVKADRITAIGPELGSLFAGSEIVKPVLKEWMNMYRREIKSSSYDEVQAHSRISRTLCAGLHNDMAIQNVYWRRDTESDIPSVASFQQLLSGDLSALDDGYVPGVVMATANRALYITETGGIGLCSSGARHGDTVWTLIGANVPFVLRKTSDEYIGQNAHQLIGDCFMLGGMDGEILRSGKAEEYIVLV